MALTLADPADGRELNTRMFAPAMGIAEDPATGAAAVAIAGLLAERQRPPAGTTRWLIRQGFDMGRPSLIESRPTSPAMRSRPCASAAAPC